MKVQPIGQGFKGSFYVFPRAWSIDETLCRLRSLMGRLHRELGIEVDVDEQSRRSLLHQQEPPSAEGLRSPLLARRRADFDAPCPKLDPRRQFDAEQHAEISRRAGGHCEGCGMPLRADWHADHLVPHSRGGRTEVPNGLALCPKCNGRKRAHLLMREKEENDDGKDSEQRSNHPNNECGDQGADRIGAAGNAGTL